MKDFLESYKNLFGTFQVICTGFGGFLGWFLGNVDGLLKALIVFVVVDYLTGVMLAILNRKLSSEIGFKGIFKKVLIFTLVGVGNIIDVHVLKNGSAIRTAIIFFYLSNEGISILENYTKIGLPIPEKLRMVLEQFNKTESTEGQ